MLPSKRRKSAAELLPNVLVAKLLDYHVVEVICAKLVLVCSQWRRSLAALSVVKYAEIHFNEKRRKHASWANYHLSPVQIVCSVWADRLVHSLARSSAGSCRSSWFPFSCSRLRELDLCIGSARHVVQLLSEDLPGLEILRLTTEIVGETQTGILKFPPSLKRLALESISWQLDLSNLADLKSLHLISCSRAAIAASLPPGLQIDLRFDTQDVLEKQYQALTAGQSVRRLEFCDTLVDVPQTLPVDLEQLYCEDHWTYADFVGAERLGFGFDTLLLRLRHVELVNVSDVIEALAPWTPNVESLVAKNLGSLFSAADKSRLEKAKEALLLWPQLRAVDLENWCPDLNQLPSTLERFALRDKHTIVTREFILTIQGRFSALTSLRLLFISQENFVESIDIIGPWTSNGLIDAVFCRSSEYMADSDNFVTLVNKREGLVDERFLAEFPNIRYSR